MERLVEHVVSNTLPSNWAFLALGRIDRRSLIAALAGGVVFFLLAYASIQVSRFGGTLATIWLPGATATALLLRPRLENEVPLLLSLTVGIALANLSAGFPITNSVLFALANLVEVSVVVALTRRSCGFRPDMTNIDHLARFVWYGGLVGPLTSVAVVAGFMVASGGAFLASLSGWIVTHSMGMILIVPTALLLAEAVKHWRAAKPTRFASSTMLVLVGLGCAFLVFNQAQYPLLFLIPPITLLYAFRIGSIGTALFVILMAAMTMTMTWSGLGPIAAA
ncbi:MAG: MASE1 domain-containing protein, partial [Pseudomonadota bacterium]